MKYFLFFAGLKKFNSIESPKPHRCSSSSLASHWSSISDSHSGYLVPWTKRQQKSKKNRPKSKPKLSDYRISSSFDRIRSARYDYEEHKRISVTDDKVELPPRFDNEKNSVMTNLLHSRRSLSRSSYHVIACCDGVFGCDWDKGATPGYDRTSPKLFIGPTFPPHMLGRLRVIREERLSKFEVIFSVVCDHLVFA